MAIRKATVVGGPALERNGMRERFTWLVPAFRALARRAVAGRGIHIQDAEDITQTALAEAVAGLPRFQGESDAQLTSWFGAIVHNRMVKFLRSDELRQRREGSILDGTDPASAAAIDPDDFTEEMATMLRSAIGRLPARQRAAIRFYFFEGKDLAAIARKLGISAEAARKVKARGLVRLRAILRGGDLLTSRRKARISISARGIYVAELARVPAGHSGTLASSATRPPPLALFFSLRFRRWLELENRTTNAANAFGPAEGGDCLALGGIFAGVSNADRKLGKKIKTANQRAWHRAMRGDQ